MMGASPAILRLAHLAAGHWGCACAGGSILAKVFISHSWQDKSFVRRLASKLTSAGLDVWVDEAEIKVGDSLITKIREGIDTSDFIIAVISETSVQSKWVQQELDTAMNYQISGRPTKVLPIITDPPSRITLPSFLVGKLYADMSSDENFAQGLKALLTSLGVDYGQYRTVHSDALKQQSEVRLASRRLVEHLKDNNYDEAYDRMRALSSKSYQFAHDDLEFIDRLGRILTERAPLPFQREAINYLARSKNESFSIYLDPVFSSPSEQLLQDAVEAEITLGSERHIWEILGLLAAERKKSLLMKALTFFTRVRPKDKGFGEELLNRLTKLINTHRDDAAILTAAVYAARWQAYHEPRIYTEFLLDNSPSCSDLVVEEVISMIQGGGSDRLDQDYALSIVHESKAKDFCKAILSRNSAHLKLHAFEFASSLNVFSDDELWHLTDKWSDEEIVKILEAIGGDDSGSEPSGILISRLEKLRDQRPRLLRAIDEAIARLDSDAPFREILAVKAEPSSMTRFAKRLVYSASSFQQAASSELGGQAITRALDYLSASFQSLAPFDRLMYLSSSLLAKRITVSAFAKQVKSLDELDGNLVLFSELVSVGRHAGVSNDAEFQDALDWLGVQCGVYKDG